MSRSATRVAPIQARRHVTGWVRKVQVGYAKYNIANTVEGYFSILKRGIYGVYHHVSEAHLRRYLSEFDYRYNTRTKLGVDDVQRAAAVVIGAKGKRLTYETTGRGRQAQAGGATA